MVCKQYSEEEKIACVEEFKRMDRSVSATGFAKGHDIPASTFNGWIKEYENMSFGRIRIEQCVVPPISKSNRNTIVFASENIRIELKENFSKELLKKIVGVLIDA